MFTFNMIYQCIGRKDEGSYIIGKENMYVSC